jgi:hypothetical protein
MVKIAAYYGSVVVESKLAAFHHDNTICPDGARVPPDDRTAGTGGRPLCNWCRNH